MKLFFLKKKNNYELNFSILKDKQLHEFDYVKGFFFYFSVPIAILPGVIIDACKAFFKECLPQRFWSKNIS